MTWRPLSPDALVEGLVDLLAAHDGLVRVAVDGPPCAEPHRLADALAEPLRVLGRPFAHVRAETFWRDASVRLEYGHEDVESYAGWLDHRAVQREVLTAAADRGEYLPSLRDPATDRSTREAPVPLEPGTVLAVSGPLLLGLGLAFDVVVHLAMSPAARARRTPADEAWTLPAYDDYDEQVHPDDLADVVVRLDDPRRPAARGLGRVLED